MNKSASREMAFKFLYSLEIIKNEDSEQFELFCNTNEINDEKTKKYIEDLYNKINLNKLEIEKLISENLKTGWNINRISKVNITILKIAICEMLYKNLPYKIGVNEAVELAKTYGDETSASFVNGILASIIKQKNIS